MAVPVTIVDKNGAPVTVVSVKGQAVDFGSFVTKTSVGEAQGPAGPLDGSGKIPASQLPPLDHDVGRAATQAEMLALVVSAPAVCIRTDFTPPHVFYLTAEPATTLANWVDTGEFGAGGANPTATVGLVAKNGVANSFMRSDGAPALDQTIAPTWTARHTFATYPQVVAPVDGTKLWLAKYATGTGHTDAPKTLGAASAYLQLGGREYGSTGFSGIGFGYVSDPTQHPPVWIGHEEVDTAGNTTGDAVIATRAGTTNVAPVARLRVTKLGELAIGADRTAVGTAGQVLTSAGAGAPPAWQDHALPAIVGSDAKLAQAANVNVPAAYNVTTSGTYRVSTYIVITQAATTSASLPGVSVTYTEAATSIGMSDIASLGAVANLVGTHTGGSVVIQALQGSTIGYTTNNYASAGATPMQYQVRVVIERLA